MTLPLKAYLRQQFQTVPLFSSSSPGLQAAKQTKGFFPTVHSDPEYNVNATQIQSLITFYRPATVYILNSKYPADLTSGYCLL